MENDNKAHSQSVRRYCAFLRLVLDGHEVNTFVTGWGLFTMPENDSPNSNNN